VAVAADLETDLRKERAWKSFHVMNPVWRGDVDGKCVGKTSLQ
jgi:hypothetical protein